jgi:ornithine carbamoyltransferase
VEQLAKHSSVPVWNGLTDMYHPTQVLADLMTIREHVKKPLEKIKFVYCGDARNNMGNSLMIGCAKMGMHFVALAPKSLFPSEALVEKMRALCKETGGSITLTEDIADVKGADVIYTDVWVSMGEESQFSFRIALLEKYRVTKKMMEMTGNPNAIFLHCLPAFHDLNTSVAKEIYDKYRLEEMEVSDEVFKSASSKVFDQAENRMHTIKAVMVATIGTPRKRV